MSTFLNTSKFVKNAPLRVVFLILFSVFGKSIQTQSFVFDILLKAFTQYRRKILADFELCFQIDKISHFLSDVKRIASIGMGSG